MFCGDEGTCFSLYFSQLCLTDSFFLQFLNNRDVSHSGRFIVGFIAFIDSFKNISNQWLYPLTQSKVSPNFTLRSSHTDNSLMTLEISSLWCEAISGIFINFSNFQYSEIIPLHKSSISNEFLIECNLWNWKELAHFETWWHDHNCNLLYNW